MTFYRQFSYINSYFQPEQLAEQLKDPSQCETLLKTSTWNDGFFGIRFRNPDAAQFLGSFVPLRRVSIVDVDVPDEINIRFRLGQYVVPELKTDNTREMPTLDLSKVLPDLAATKLFIHLREAEKNQASKWILSEQFPQDLWDSLERSASIHAKANLRNALVLRWLSIRQRGTRNNLVPEEIDTHDHVWGFRLSEGAAYDIQLSYKRLVEKGKQPPAAEHRYFLANPSEELRASRRQIYPIGNYRSEELWVSPTKPSLGPITIAFEPCRIDKPEAAVDQTDSRTIGLRVPVLVEQGKWPKDRWVNLAFAVVSLMLFAGAFYRYPVVSDPEQKLLLALLAASFSLLVSSMKDFFMPKR